MKIAITGASGFLGTEIIRELQNEGEHNIVALTRTGKEAQEGIQWVTTDYTADHLADVLTGCSCVLHLAAIRGTTGRIADYQENEILTENLLLAMKKAEVKRMVFASSIAVYSDVNTIPWTEEMPLTPKTLYGITKASCEYLCQYHARTGNMEYTIFRIAQVLGTQERRKGMMNVFLDTAREHGQLCVSGKSTAKRQFIFVEDLAKAFVWAARKEQGSHIYNLGMPEAYTNLKIAQLVNEAFRNPTPIAYDDSFPEAIEPSDMDVSRLTARIPFRLHTMPDALNCISHEKLHIS